MQRSTASKYAVFVLAVFSLLCSTLLIKGIINQVPTGAWAPAGTMALPRSGAATVALQDGRLLITGGGTAGSCPGGSGASAEIFDASGNFSAAACMSFARSKHTATVLQDGRVVVVGGVGGGGTAIDSAELYDPVANTWTVTGSLKAARSGHTASLLVDGTVLIAGGDNAGVAQNSLEVFDPTAGAFTTATGALSSPRESHAGTVLQDGRVLIVGGYCSGSAQVCPNGTGPLASSDIYDPSTGSVSPGPLMSTARQGLSATTQLDGKVFVAGGNNGSVDLASTEVYDPAAGGAFAVSATLATARQGHQAFLLPHSNNILIVGGTSSGVALNSSEQYVPWTGTLNTASFMTSARSASTGSPLSQDGLLLVAGGKDSSTPPNTLQSGELYGFATVKTDKADYPPGTTVNITGSGWQPGETVALTLVESPLIDTHGPYTVTVQPDGTFSDSSFTTDIHDLDVHFTLTVVGSASQAQMTFTDAKGNLNSFTVSCSGPVGVGNPS